MALNITLALRRVFLVEICGGKVSARGPYVCVLAGFTGARSVKAYMKPFACFLSSCTLIIFATTIVGTPKILLVVFSSVRK